MGLARGGKKLSLFTVLLSNTALRKMSSQLYMNCQQSENLSKEHTEINFIEFSGSILFKVILVFKHTRVQTYKQHMAVVFSNASSNCLLLAQNLNLGIFSPGLLWIFFWGGKGRESVWE